MSKKLIMASLTASLAGFLFGFDTVVISGANLPLKELWNTSEWFHGTFIMSMALMRALWWGLCWQVFLPIGLAERPH